MTGLTGTQSADDLLNKPKGTGFNDSNFSASQAKLNTTLESLNPENLCIMSEKATIKASTGREVLTADDEAAAAAACTTDARLERIEKSIKRAQQSVAKARAAGGARKSRKHKRTRKHMRKHTRKHKVMKSKMTKSKSKKVMQKGGTRYTTPKEGINNDLKRLKERKPVTLRREVYETERLGVATRRIREMNEKEKEKEKKNKENKTKGY